MDCDSTNNGCNGGWYSNSLAYTQTNGFVLESDNPYANKKNDVCKSSLNAIPSTKGLPEFESCTNMDPTNLCTEEKVYTMLKKGPVAVAVDGTGQDMINYSTGIFNAKCEKMNHAVMLVGYGIDSISSQHYWVIRNSWGTGWGENGYIRILKNAANNLSCFITHSAFQIPLKSKSTETTTEESTTTTTSSSSSTSSTTTSSSSSTSSSS